MRRVFGPVSLPLVLQHGLYLTITLMLWLALLPLLIFPSSSPPSASPAPVPSASSPPRSHRVIMGSGSRPSSFLTELLSPFLARLHLHYCYCCARPMEANMFYIKPRTSQNMLFRCSFIFYDVNLKRIKKKLGISTLRACSGSWLLIKRDYFVSQSQRE